MFAANLWMCVYSRVSVGKLSQLCYYAIKTEQQQAFVLTSKQATTLSGLPDSNNSQP